MFSYFLACHNADGRIKDKADIVLNGQDDQVDINYVLASLSEDVGGNAGISAGEVITSDSVFLAERTELVLSHSTIVRSQIDVNVICVTKNSFVRGGSIDAQDVSNFSKAALFFDCQHQFNVDWKKLITGATWMQSGVVPVPISPLIRVNGGN